MALRQTAIQRIWERLIGSSELVVPHTTEPAHPSLFTASRKRSNPAVVKQCVLGTRPAPGQVRLTRLEWLCGCVSATGVMFVDVRHGSVEFNGVPACDSLVEARSQADGPDESQARRLLERVAIHYQKGHLRLLNPPNRKRLHCLSQFVIMCPRERAVKVRGVYSAVSLSELSGGADIETTHARITLLNVCSVVNARVVKDIIDYSGYQGQIQLFAGWEINLNFTSPIFEGVLTATAEGPIRVLLPLGFATPFEATVAKGASFVCRADIKTQILRHYANGRLVYTFGEGSPTIRLISMRGPVVIDNAADPSEQVVEHAMLPPPTA